MSVCVVGLIVFFCLSRDLNRGARLETYKVDPHEGIAETKPSALPHLFGPHHDLYLSLSDAISTSYHRDSVLLSSSSRGIPPVLRKKEASRWRTWTEAELGEKGIFSVF
jgi:hypothetical protein